MRPLLDDESGDPSAVTRDYLLDLDRARRAAAHGLGRQDHHLPQARRGGRPTCSPAPLGSAARRLDARRAPARRRPERPGSARRSGPTPTSCASCRRWRCAIPTWPAPLLHRLARGLRRARRAAARRRRRSAPRSRPACTRPSCATCTTTNGRAAPTTCSGGAASSACTSAPAERAAVADWCAAHWPDAPARRGDGDGAGMELTLERIEQRVGAADHLYPLDLTLVPRAVTVLLGATQAGKTTLMRVMAGLDAPSAGPRARRRRGRDRRAGARAQRRDGLPAVHQLPVDDGGRQHRLAAAAARREERRRARAGARRQAAHRALPRRGCRPSSRAASSSASRWRARWPRTRR